MAGAYAAELARIHHEAYGFVARAATPVVLAALRSAHHRGLVVDLGCGSGITAAGLLDAGYDVLGVDASADMVDLAGRTAPGARFVVGSAHDVDLPACVGVTAIGEVVGYAADPAAPAPSLARLARRVHDALAPGGVFVLDVAGPGRLGRDGTRQAVAEGSDWLLAMRAQEDSGARRLRRDITVFVREGERWRRHDERHVLHLHAPEEVEQALASAGFQVSRFVAYGDLPLGDGWTGFLARKAP